MGDEAKSHVTFNLSDNLLAGLREWVDRTARLARRSGSDLRVSMSELVEVGVRRELDRRSVRAEARITFALAPGAGRQAAAEFANIVGTYLRTVDPSAFIVVDGADALGANVAAYLLADVQDEAEKLLAEAAADTMGDSPEWTDTVSAEVAARPSPIRDVTIAWPDQAAANAKG